MGLNYNNKLMLIGDGKTCVRSSLGPPYLPPYFPTRQPTTTHFGCSTNPCLNGGTCTAVGLFGYNCSCPPNTVPPRCALRSRGCLPNPCLHGGTCEYRQHLKYWLRLSFSYY